jgi:hypothetical protein
VFNDQRAWRTLAQEEARETATSTAPPSRIPLGQSKRTPGKPKRPETNGVARAAAGRRTTRPNQDQRELRNSRPAARKCSRTGSGFVAAGPLEIEERIVLALPPVMLGQEKQLDFGALRRVLAPAKAESLTG